MDLLGGFFQDMAFCLDSLMSDKVLVLITDFSSGGTFIAPCSLDAFLYDKCKSLCKLGVRGTGNSISSTCLFFFLYSYLVQKLLPHSQKWFYLALFPQEVRVKKVVV